MNSKPVFPFSCRFISAIKFNDSSALFCCHTIIISPIFADLALEAKLGEKANYILTDSLYICIIYFFLLVFSNKRCVFETKSWGSLLYQQYFCLLQGACPASTVSLMGVCPVQSRSHRGPGSQQGPALGSMLCCCHLETLSTVGQRALQFHFARGSADYTARTACLKKENINVYALTYIK